MDAASLTDMDRNGTRRMTKTLKRLKQNTLQPETGFSVVSRAIGGERSGRSSSANITVSIGRLRLGVLFSPVDSTTSKRSHDKKRI